MQYKPMSIVIYNPITGETLEDQVRHMIELVELEPATEVMFETKIHNLRSIRQNVIYEFQNKVGSDFMQVSKMVQDGMASQDLELDFHELIKDLILIDSGIKKIFDLRASAIKF